MKREKDLLDEFYDCFGSASCDFARAKRLLAQGLDINALYNDEDLLSGAMLELTGQDNPEQEPSCLLEVVKFFLKNGFDVAARGGAAGSECLGMLRFFANLDEALEAAKLLLDKGARCVEDEDGLTPLSLLGGESHIAFSERDYRYSMCCEVLCEVIERAENNVEYHGIKFADCHEYGSLKAVWAQRLDSGRRAERWLLVFEQKCMFVDNFCAYYDDIPGGNFADISSLFKEIIGREVTQVNPFGIARSGGTSSFVEVALGGISVIFKRAGDNLCEVFTDSGETRGCAEFDNAMRELKVPEREIAALIGLGGAAARKSAIGYARFASKETEIGAYEVAYFIRGYERTHGEGVVELRHGLYARCVKAVAAAKEGEIYSVEGVDGEKGNYILKNIGTVSADDFKLLRPSKVRYEGKRIADNVRIAKDGCKIWGVYDVKRAEGRWLILRGGEVVASSDCTPLEYAPIEDMAPRRWTNVDIAVSEAIEFGVKPDCFVAEDAAVFADGEKVADGKEETLDYFQTIFRTRVDNGIYCVAYEAHSEEKWKGHDKGERFVFVRCSDGTTMSVFLGRFNDRKLLSAEVFSGNPKASFTRYDVR